MLHGSQIAESYGSPLIPFDFLPSGRLPPPPQKARWGSPLGQSTVSKWFISLRSRTLIFSHFVVTGACVVFWSSALRIGVKLKQGR